METKICTKCKEAKPLSDFGKYRNDKNVLRSQCRACQSAAAREWFHNNRARAAARLKKWRANNPLKSAEYAKKWRNNNPEKTKGCKERYYASHREQIDKVTKLYHKNHPEKVSIWQKKHRDSHPIILKAYRKVNNNPALITVLTECPCNYPMKHKHHPDYNKPFEVIRLCPSCHAAEHKRLRSLQPALAEAI
jgi:hypothetical protein